MSQLFNLTSKNGGSLSGSPVLAKKKKGLRITRSHDSVKQNDSLSLNAESATIHPPKQNKSKKGRKSKDHAQLESEANQTEGQILTTHKIIDSVPQPEGTQKGNDKEPREHKDEKKDKKEKEHKEKEHKEKERKEKEQHKEKEHKEKERKEKEQHKEKEKDRKKKKEHKEKEHNEKERKEKEHKEKEHKEKEHKEKEHKEKEHKEKERKEKEHKEKEHKEKEHKEKEQKEKEQKEKERKEKEHKEKEHKEKERKEKEHKEKEQKEKERKEKKEKEKELHKEKRKRASTLDSIRLEKLSESFNASFSGKSAKDPDHKGRSSDSKFEDHHGLDTSASESTSDTDDKKQKKHNKTLLHLVEEKPVLKFKKNKLGITIYKGHPSWELMHNIQLGIRYNCGRSAMVISDDAMRKLSKHQLFHSPDTQKFPSLGSNFTPSHGFPDFKFKDYSPLVFRHLREKFNISTEEYMTSLCSEHALRELPTPGKSGSLFFFSQDMKYILKTIPKAEAKVLINVLPAYYKYALVSHDTLLPRFFGLHRIKTQKGARVRMVVMGNIFWTTKILDLRFDLKGSTLGREASERQIQSLKKNVTYKDLDWKRMNIKLKIRKQTRQLLTEQFQKDIKFLMDNNLIDYSLLIGISTDPQKNEYKDPEQFQVVARTSSLTSGSAPTVTLSSDSDSSGSSSFDTAMLPDLSDEESVSSSAFTGILKHPFRLISPTASEAPSLTNSASFVISSPTVSNNNNHMIPTNSASNLHSRPTRQGPPLRQSFQTSFRLPKKFRNPHGSVFQVDSGGIQGCDKTGQPIEEWYYLGIIDILMPHSVFKIGEREYKRMLFPDLDPSSTSPKHYGQRLMTFIKKYLFDDEIP